MYYKFFFIYLIIFPKEQNLVRFASKTFKEMKELGITSLNISDSNAVLENDDVGIFRIIFGKNDFNEIDEEEVDSKKQSITIKNKKVNNFFILLIH